MFAGELTGGTVEVEEEGRVRGNSGGNGGRRTAGGVSLVSEGDLEANASAILNPL